MVMPIHAISPLHVHSNESTLLYMLAFCEVSVKHKIFLAVRRGTYKRFVVTLETVMH